MVSIIEVFNIPLDYTLEQLKSSYLSIIEKLSKSNNSSIEKYLLTEQYKKLYKYGKQLYLERMLTEFEQNEKNKPNESNEFDDSTNLHDQFNKMTLGNIDIFDMEPFRNSCSKPTNTIKYPNSFEKFNNVFGQMMNLTSNSISNSIPNSRSRVYSYSSSYKSTSNPDGSRTVVESKSELKNGDKKNTLNAYKKLSNGKVIPLTSEEIEQMKQIEFET